VISCVIASGAFVLLARYLRTHWRKFRLTLVDDVVEATGEMLKLKSRSWTRSLQGQVFT